MKFLIAGIVLAVIVFLVSQMILPFPFGLVFGVPLAVIIIRYSLKHDSKGKDSLLNYRRQDPINEKEREQNDEALRILEKKYIEEKISKEEYIKQKKEFDKIEYHPKKCKVCGSEDFEFVSDERIEKPGENTSDIGYYRCKKCGAK